MKYPRWYLWPSHDWKNGGYILCHRLLPTNKQPKISLATSSLDQGEFFNAFLPGKLTNLLDYHRGSFDLSLYKFFFIISSIYSSIFNTLSLFCFSKEMISTLELFIFS